MSRYYNSYYSRGQRPATDTHSSSITVQRIKVPNDKPSYDDCMDWIYEQKTALQKAKYGKNKAQLEEALATESERSGKLTDQGRIVDRLLNNESDKEKRDRLQDAWASLKELHEKKVGCLKTMLEVANLQEDCGKLSRTIDLRAVDLVQLDKRTGKEGDQVPTAGPNIRGFIAPSAQDCIFGLKDNWEWIVKCVKCTDIHLRNSSDYHQVGVSDVITTGNGVIKFF